MGQAAKRPPRAGRLEDEAEVGRRLCPNPEARRGHSKRQTTIGTDDNTLSITILSYPGSVFRLTTPGTIPLIIWYLLGCNT